MIMFRHLLAAVLFVATTVSIQAQTSRVPAAPAPPHYGISKTSGQLAARTSATIHKPGTTVQYEWENGAWDRSSALKTVTSYNAQGLPNQQIVSDSSTSVPSLRVSYSYDGQGRPTQYLSASWSNGAWANLNRYIISYDGFGDITGYAIEDWVSGTWVNSMAFRYVISRSGSLIQQVEQEVKVAQAPIFSKVNRTVYTISNGQYTAVSEQDWDNGAYVEKERTLNIVWADWAQRRLASYDEQLWNTADARWVEFRHALTHSSTSIVTVSQEKENNTWTNTFRETITFDGPGNQVGSREESWDGTAWELDEERRTLISYGANDRILREITQVRNQTAPAFVNVERTNYSDFQAIITAARNQDLAASATLYPNPAVEHATFSLTGLRSSAPIKAELISNIGQVVRTFELQPKQGALHETLNLSALPSGVYSLRLNTSEGAVVKRFVRQ
ncbi:T9SS type A sorting domain-containing protein [Hymenobacter koreensis]|uniref:Secretion system C-terminal sorting domain-containing protein n=1 Tax=Hymenobacter koreensis TaxID=1084523 RepID=A0ABP8ITH7_9BACT